MALAVFLLLNPYLLLEPEIFQRSFGRTLRDYGYTSSPLVYQNQLLVEVGGKTGTVAAFDKNTGKQLWLSECRDEAGHSGGLVPITVGTWTSLGGS